MTIITDPLFYLLALPAVIALGLSKGGFAGVGQMATPLLALVMPPLEAAAILLPIMIVQDAIAVWVYRKDYSGRIMAIVLPGALIGVGCGWLLAAHISDAAVRVFTGAATMTFVLYSWIGPTVVANEVAKDVAPTNVPAGVFWGLLSGFTSTIGAGRRAAVPDLRAVAETAENDFRRHHGHRLRHGQLAQGSALFRARAILDQGSRHVVGAAAAGDRYQPASASGWCA